MARRLLIWFWNQPKETFLDVHSSTGICRGRGATAPRRQDNKYTHHLEALQPALLFPGLPPPRPPGRGDGRAAQLNVRPAACHRSCPCAPQGTGGPPPRQTVAVSTRGPLGSDRMVLIFRFCPPSPRPVCVCLSLLVIFFQLKFCGEWEKKIYKPTLVHQH